MNVDPAVGKILGMVMAYAVSALGLLLAYYNYRKRIVKADHIFTPRAQVILWVVGTLGQPVRYLTRACAAAWSPDGRTVAYANAHGDIYQIAALGGEPQLLHREDAPADRITPILCAAAV